MALNLQDAVEPMDVGDGNDNHAHHEVLVENATLDLEAYANSYTGQARLDRLVHVASVCPSMRLEALKMALNYVTHSNNVTMYQMLFLKLEATVVENGNGGGPFHLPGVGTENYDLPSYDPCWVEDTSKQAALKLEKLQADIRNYKFCSSKASTRLAYNDLADYYLGGGDLQNALKCYLRSRDYCTSDKDMVNVYLNIIKVSLHQKNWENVANYVNKADSKLKNLEYLEDPTKANVTFLKCAGGLADMQRKNYKMAAKQFSEAIFNDCNFPEIFSPNNIATYGGICALATFDRQELQDNIISSFEFKQFLELESELRNAIEAFYESKYASCFKLLNDMRGHLMLDMFIAPLISILYSKIRNRALMQYVSPYDCVDMIRMAVVFNCSVESLENEIVALIENDQIQARIDSHRKILYTKETNKRNEAYKRIMDMGAEGQRRARMMLVRSAVLQNNILVKAEPRKTGKEDAGVSTAPIIPAIFTQLIEPTVTPTNK